MKPRFAILLLLLLGVLLSTPRLGQTAYTNGLQDQLRYNFGYSCKGDAIIVIRCRHQSDTPEFPATRPENDYCSVIYPDRPKRNGMQVNTTELYADVVKRLQACATSNAPAATTSGPNAPATTTTSPTAPSDILARDHILLGDNNRSEKKYAEAIAHYKKSISIEPSVDAYNRLSVVYADDLKQSQEALVVLQAALRLSPNEPSVHHNLGSVYYDLEQYEKAAAAAQQAIRLKPDRAQDWNLLGVAYRAMDKYAEAIAAHQEAARLQPSNAKYIDNLVLAYLDIGRREDALEACKLLQKVNPAKGKERYEDINLSFGTPDNDVANLDFGLSLYQDMGTRGYVNALRALRRAVSLTRAPGTSGRAHYVIGEIYQDEKKPTLATGEFEQAAAAFQQAIRVEPREASNYYWLGMADVELGRKEAARQVYTTLQRIDRAKAKELYAEINKKE